jgi:ABC-type transport system substrate-binding protein
MENSYWSTLLHGRIRRRRLTAAAGAAALSSALLAACGGSGNGGSGLKLDDAGVSREPGSVWQAKNDWKLADETKQAVRGGIYRDVRPDDVISHWDPAPQESANAAYGATVYEFLMHRNRGPGVDPTSLAYQTPVPALAEGWEVSEDGLRVVFTMRPNVKFQSIAPVNGRVMDIDDWKTSHDRHMATGNYRNQLQQVLSKVEYPDATHMVWNFNTPMAPLFDRIFDRTFAYHIMPKELNANPGIAEKWPIGTGPKQLDKFEPSIRVEFKKHAGYWGGDPFIDRWHEPIVPEYTNRYAQFVAGNITDFAPTARDILQLHKDAPGAVIVAGELDTENACRVRIGKTSPLNYPWGKDARVRIAIRRSIDYVGIAQVLSNKAEFEANGIPVEMGAMTHVMPVPAYWLNPEKGELGELSQNYIFNAAEAKKLTAAAGYPGLIDLPYYVSLSNAGAMTDAEQLVIDSLKRSGVWNLDVKQVPVSEYRVKINIDAAYDGIQQQSCSAGAGTDYVMFRDYHSKAGTVPPAIVDPEIDRLAELQRRTIDIEKRNQVFKDIQLYWAKVMPLMPGQHRYTVFTARWPWLHNSNYAANRTANPDLGLHLHWLDKDMPSRDRPV